MIFTSPEQIRMGMEVMIEDKQDKSIYHFFKITTEKKLKEVQEEYYEYEPFKLLKLKLLKKK